MRRSLSLLRKMAVQEIRILGFALESMLKDWLSVRRFVRSECRPEAVARGHS